MQKPLLPRQTLDGIKKIEHVVVYVFKHQRVASFSFVKQFIYLLNYFTSIPLFVKVVGNYAHTNFPQYGRAHNAPLAKVNVLEKVSTLHTRIGFG